MKKSFLIKRVVIISLITISLVACATVHVNMEERYHALVRTPSSNERVIFEVSVDGDVRECTVAGHETRAATPLGAQRNVTLVGSSREAGPGRHPDEEILDRLLVRATSLFPNENVSIRSANVSNSHTNSRQVVRVQGQPAQTVFDCRLVWKASIITTDPMPQPVTHSADLSIAGLSRADIYRRTHNYLSDLNNPRRSFNSVNFHALEIQQADIDMGRIRGVYSFIVNTGQNYRISSIFTIDIQDARATISFANATLIRETGIVAQRGEPIFLQSIANLAQQEIETFTNRLIQGVTQR
jgi:hypothetical protein